MFMLRHNSFLFFVEIQNKFISIGIFWLVIRLKHRRSNRTKNSAETSSDICRVSIQSIVPYSREGPQTNSCSLLSYLLAIGLSRRGIHRQMQTGTCVYTYTCVTMSSGSWGAFLCAYWERQECGSVALFQMPCHNADNLSQH